MRSNYFGTSLGKDILQQLVTLKHEHTTYPHFIAGVASMLDAVLGAQPPPKRRRQNCVQELVL